MDRRRTMLGMALASGMVGPMDENDPLKRDGVVDECGKMQFRMPNKETLEIEVCGRGGGAGGGGSADFSSFVGKFGEAGSYGCVRGGQAGGGGTSSGAMTIRNMSLNHAYDEVAIVIGMRAMCDHSAARHIFHVRKEFELMVRQIYTAPQNDWQERERAAWRSLAVEVVQRLFQL